MKAAPKKRDFTKPVFVDAASDAGLEFTFHADYVPGRYYLPEIMGGGVGCVDYDRDGWMDLFLPNGSILIPAGTVDEVIPTDAFFRNRGGRFERASESAGLNCTEYGQGCAVADYDADGFPDIYLANYGKNVLYRNNGDGTFSANGSRTVGGMQLWSTSPAWVDLNSDGLLDLYVVNYLNVRADNVRTCKYDGYPGYCGPGEYSALPDEAFLNLGNGEFEEAAGRLGLVGEMGKGLAVDVVDFDGDLLPEIYVANDMAENFLFTRTQMAGTSKPPKAPFQNVARLSGCGTSESGMNEASMGVACADFDFDLRPDMFLTHFYHQKNTLYHNRGNLTFFDDSRRFRVVVSSNDYLGFGVIPLDYDSNGAVDVFVANGHVLGPEFPVSVMSPQLIANVDGKYFEDASPQAGDCFQEKSLGRGAANVDFDNDGDADVAVSRILHPAALLRNDTARVMRDIIGLVLEDRFRHPPIGGRVEVECGTYRRAFPIASGGSYLSSPDPRLLIPVPLPRGGSATVRVYWPSGDIYVSSSLTPGRYWYVREGFDPYPLPEFTAQR